MLPFMLTVAKYVAIYLWEMIVFVTKPLVWFFKIMFRSFKEGSEDAYYLFKEKMQERREKKQKQQQRKNDSTEHHGFDSYSIVY